VSCHTLTHPDLTRLTEAEMRREIGEDRRLLEDLTGGAVRGLAYPFGTYDERVLSLLPELGIVYGRTAEATDAFQLPDNFLEWGGSCHHNRAYELGQRFLREESQRPALLYVWGHSYELDGFMSGDLSKNWDYMDAFCRLMGQRDDIYYATAIEVVDFLISGALHG
jgi:hypothetical protein